MATENGLARFDGRNFKMYNTKDGLSDNEIIEMFTDSSGMFWVFPFRHSPCYYNLVSDRFENSETDIELKKIETQNTHIPHILKYGGVLFTNNLRDFFIYKNKKVTAYKNLIPYKTPTFLRVVEYKKNEYLFCSEDSIRKFVNGKFSNIVSINKRIVMAEVVDTSIYIATPQSILHYTFSNSGKVSFNSETSYPFTIRIFCYTSKHFSLTSLSGTTYLLDNTTLKPIEIISAAENLPIRSVLEDKEGNYWLSSMEGGLIKVQNKRISILDVKELKQNFNSILADKKIIAGNNHGELFFYDGLYPNKLLLNNTKNLDAWVRKIIKTDKGYFVATQAGSYMIDNNFIKPIWAFKGTQNYSSKAAFLVNDSTLLLGSHSSAYLYNYKTQKNIDSIVKRVTALCQDKYEHTYIGSTEGLYLWQNKKIESFEKQSKGLAVKINCMVSTPDSLFWVGTGFDSFFVLKNNQVIASLSLGDIIPGNICKSLCSNKKGEVWLGTNKGLNRIFYSYDNNKFNYSNTYFGVTDGLIGEQVNDISIKDSIVYVATNEGISFLPTNLLLPIVDIPVYITGVTVNGLKQQMADNYELRYFENDISIEYSGVELTGFIPIFEYSINGSNWLRTDKVDLKRLAPGNYNISIRALRRDGKAGTGVASIKIKIRTPFWKSGFFWTSFAFSIFGLLLYLQQKRNKQKQKTAVEKISTEKRLTELEMQALKAQINPHFVFNCLNSIKGFIYDRDYLQADKYLDKFSALMRSTVDNSDAAIITLKNEIDYLDNYLQLEILRFEDKFVYSISVQSSIKQNEVYVPAMLLQPYVENAIRHGMRYLENKNGQIKIDIKKNETHLICMIDDNGIGREKAANLKSNLHTEYQSKGMTISKRRADLYKIGLEIEDKKNEEGSSAGTTIIVSIPINLKP